jgi:hypothetical protein
MHPPSTCEGCIADQGCCFSLCELAWWACVTEGAVVPHQSVGVVLQPRVVGSRT